MVADVELCQKYNTDKGMKYSLNKTMPVKADETHREDVEVIRKGSENVLGHTD